MSRRGKRKRKPAAKPPRNAGAARSPATAADERSLRPVDSADARHTAAAHRWWQRPWLPMLLALVCYANTLGHDFTYDDNYIIRRNVRITDPVDFTAIWGTDWWHAVGADLNVLDPRRDLLYRPLTMHSFALNYAAGGLVPFGYHLLNVLLHVGVTGLVWLLARRLSGSLTIAAITGLLFAVHPVHVEAVAGVVGRAEVLAALFLAAGLLVLLPHARAPGWGRVAAAAPLFFLALASKETAVVYPLLALIVVAFCYGVRKPTVVAAAPLLSSRRDWSRRIMQFALLLVPMLPYFALRYVALEQRLAREKPLLMLMNPLITAEGLERAWGALTVFGHYVRLLVAPVTLSYDYGLAIVDPESGPDVYTWLGLASAPAVLIALAGFRSRRPLWRAAACGTALFLGSYVLIANVFLLIGVSLAERLMYWPSVFASFVFAIVAVGLHRFTRQRSSSPQRVGRLLPLLGALLVLALGLRTIDRNTVWRDDATLFSSDVDAFTDAEGRPLGVHILVNHARVLVVRAEAYAGVLRQAADRLEALRARYPDNRAVLALLARVRQGQGAEDDAAALLGRVGNLTAPDFAAAESALPSGARRDLQIAAELWRQGSQYAAGFDAASELMDTAEAEAQLALTRFPSATNALELLARIARLRGDQTTALRRVEQALRLDPRDSDLRALQAELRGETDHERIAALEARVRAEPGDVTAVRELARLLIRAGREDRAQALLAESVARRPDDVETRALYAQTLALNDQVSDAVREYRTVVELDPDNWEAHTNLSGLLGEDDPAAALNHARRAFELKPNDIRVAVNYASALELNGQVDQALRIYRAARDAVPADDPLRETIRRRIADLE